MLPLRPGIAATAVRQVTIPGRLKLTDTHTIIFGVHVKITNMPVICERETALDEPTDHGDALHRSRSPNSNLLFVISIF